MIKHYSFYCPFCSRKITPRSGARACTCMYWINPVSISEQIESEEQHELLANLPKEKLGKAQRYWTELKH